MSGGLALHRKLLRDLWGLRTQLLSIALVVACGVMTVVALRGTYEALSSARDRYYREYRFADIFASLERAPVSVAGRIEELPGVAEADTRVQQWAQLEVPGLEVPAQGLILSIPPAPERTLNAIHVARGTYPSSAREVLVSERFARAHQLDPGDTLDALIDGTWWPLEVSGVALSPDYTGEFAPGGAFPDEERFAILRMRRDALAPAAGMEGAFNDLSVKLAPGANAAEVIAGIDRLLRPWGGLGAHGREDQQSHVAISGELEQNRISGTVIPAIFLGVAAFLLNVVLARLVGTQRQEIAILKAFGYSNAQIGRHYLSYALAPALFGSALGIALGAWAGDALTRVYGLFFRFPELTYVIRWELAVIAVGVSVAAAAVGALSSVRGAVALPPAEAMRPEAPATFKPGPVERLGLGRLLSASGRLILRNVERRGLRSASAVLGIALAEMLVLTGLSFFDATDWMLEVQFARSQRQALSVEFTNPRPSGVEEELEHLPGVHRAELQRTVSVRLHHENRRETVALIGLSEDGALRRVVDEHGVIHPPPSSGVMLSASLAERLGAAPGERVRVEALEGQRRERSFVVSRVVDELFGQGAYMELGTLQTFMREGDLATGANLAADRADVDALQRRLTHLPGVRSVQSPEAMRESFQEQINESLMVSITVLLVLACVLTIGIVYNGARIALAERSRELASLRVLGFTQREIAVLLLGEQGVLTALAIPLGWLLGVAFVASLMAAFETEQFRIPVVISVRSLLMCGGVTLLAAALAGLSVRQRLRHLDLIGVLKTRE